MASQINLGSQSAQKSYDDLKLVIGNLTNQMHLGTDEQGQLLNALERTVDSGGTAQDAYNNVMAAVKNMGGNTETAARIFSEVFPNAVQATKTSVDKNIVGAQQTVTDFYGKDEDRCRNESGRTPESSRGRFRRGEHSNSDKLGQFSSGGG